MKNILKLISKSFFKFLGIIDLALKNICRRKTRTLLTSTAIAIGVVLIVVMVSLGLGVNKWLIDEIAAQTDMRMITVLPPSIVTKPIFKTFIKNSKIGEDHAKKDAILSAEMIDDFKKIPHVEAVTPMLEITVDSVSVEGEQSTVYSPLTSARSFSRDDLYIKKLLAGDLYSLDNRSDGIVVTTFFLRRLGVVNGPYDNWIGRKVTLTIPTKIAPTGIVSTTVESKQIQGVIVAVIDVDLHNSDLFVNLDSAVMLLAESAEMSKDDFLKNIGYYTALIRTDDVKNTKEVADVIERLGFIARTAQDYIKMINNWFTTIQIALSTFGLVALAVAALGIANTMFMSIYERTKEIGIMKAVGASRGVIRTLFLTEAGLIGLFGGIAGILLGYVIIRVVSFIALKLLQDQGVPITVLFNYPWWLAVGSVIFSCLISITAGIYPSQKAASLDPVQAIRYE